MTTVVDFISRIYPGAEIVLGENCPITVKRFDYTYMFCQDIPHISVYDDHNIVHRLEYRPTGVFTNVFDDEYQVTLPSEPHNYLHKAWTMLPTHLFSHFISFMRKNSSGLFCEPNAFTLEEFNKEIQQQLKLFEYFMTEDPRDFLIKKISSSFRDKIQHSDDCCRSGMGMGIDFCLEHTCDDVGHLRVLLDVAIDKDIVIHRTKDECLGAVSMIRNSPQYVHITPGGSFIIGTYGQGVSNHPLTRIIFWAAMLKKHPNLHSLFDLKYKTALNEDLKMHRFIMNDCSTIHEMIEKFDTSVCVACGSVCGMQKVRNVRSWGSTTYYSRKCCDNTRDYNYHLLLLGVLRNGWHGSSSYGHTTINYLGQDETIKFRSGNILSFRGGDYFYYIRAAFATFLEAMIDEFNNEDEESSSSD